MSEKIAFIGVGNMGNPMAVNLLKAGNKIKVFDVSKQMLEKARGKNLETVDRNGWNIFTRTSISYKK